MRIEQLEHVIKMSECGSINKAAIELYVSQSNLSQSLLSLENEVGHEIFERTGKGVVLTTFGSEFLSYAKVTLEQYALTQEFCKTYSKAVPLKFSVACQYMRFANLLFMKLYEKYAHQRSEFTFLEGSFLDIINNVISHRVELGVLLIPQNQRKTTLTLMKSRGLLYHPILPCAASITVGKKNPLYDSECSEVTLDMLKDYPIAMYRDIGFNFSSEMINIALCASNNRIIVSDRNTLHEILRNTDAYSIAAYTNAYRNLEYYDDIRAFRLPDSRFAVELGWVRNYSHPLSDLGKEYITMIEASQLDH